MFNYKGMELDDSDIDYLKNNQTIYIAFEGSKFSTYNYVYQFDFVKWLKKGGFGKVFLAKNLLSNGDLVAIKETDIKELTSDEIYNISREALYLESFKHRNIIRYIMSYTVDSKMFSVMEYASGGELTQYIEEKKLLSEKEAKFIFKQIYEAVKYIHSKNVIHRDLNPNNILFVDEQRTRIVIIDFGISGMSKGNVKEKTFAGTLKFIPPEIASGENYSATPKIDNWALGVILYYLLTGENPFNGDSDREILNEIVRKEIKIPLFIKISDLTKKVVYSLLEKNFNRRIELDDPLFETWFNDDSSNDEVCVDLELKEKLMKSEENKNQNDDNYLIYEMEKNLSVSPTKKTSKNVKFTNVTQQPKRNSQVGSNVYTRSLNNSNNNTITVKKYSSNNNVIKMSKPKK